MPQERFTLDEYATMMRTNKPYLIAIEEAVEKLDYGDIDLKISVRAGQVEKMEHVSHKFWLRPKEGHPFTSFVIETISASSK